MKKLPYIEDYILLMGQDPFAWPPNAPLITLARYDENIIQSMYDQINRGLGFTDKQAVLAHKLVTKYHRQWGQNGYDVTGQIKNAKFKFPIRNIDRSKRIDIKDKFIHILFPYEQDVISVIRSSVSEVPGECYFDKELRLWVTSLIEPRIRWAKEFGDKYNFEFTETFLQVLSKVNAITDYRIELCRINGQLTITNAADSLNDYIESQVGMSDSNLIKLIDLSGPLCYTVSAELYQELPTITPTVEMMLNGKDVHINYDESIDLKDIIDYAELTGRYPIYVYETGNNYLRKEISKYFTDNDIIDRKATPTTETTGKVIYFSHWKFATVTIPLLVTADHLMIGHRRQQMIEQSEKIVYFSKRINNDTMPTTNT